jgi:hypothetical protein
VAVSDGRDDSRQRRRGSIPTLPMPISPRVIDTETEDRERARRIEFYAAQVTRTGVIDYAALPPPPDEEERRSRRPIRLDDAEEDED